jgi:pSer/pThr/pTyr-binding forkhead associated (FHA) protein
LVSHPLKDFIVKFKAGEVIYREGDPGEEMFIVQSGSIGIFRAVAGTEQELALMEKGDFFGEMSVLEGTPRTASARALENCELIEINSTVFDRMIRGNIEIAVRMLRKLSARLQEANRRMETLGAPAQEAHPAVAPSDPDRPPEPTHGAEAPVPSPGPQPPGEDEAVPFGPDWLGVLVLTDGNQVFPIRGENSLIGRYDPVTGTRPEIDLTAYDTNRSVSRRHAKVTARQGGLFVSEEVGALNGTFLNGKRLTPGKSEPIRDGDTLALGMVTLRFQGKGGTA